MVCVRENPNGNWMKTGGSRVARGLEELGLLFFDSWMIPPLEDLGWTCAVMIVGSLVGGEWLPWIWHFPRNIGLLIIPTDELIFFRGVETTNQIMFDHVPRGYPHDINGYSRIMSRDSPMLSVRGHRIDHGPGELKCQCLKGWNAVLGTHLPIFVAWKYGRSSGYQLDGLWKSVVLYIYILYIYI